MKKRHWLLVWMSVTLAFSALAGPVEEIASFSAFKQLNLDALAGGEIVSQRINLAGVRRGLAVQNCLLVRKSYDTLPEFLIFWDGRSHSELSIYLSRDFRNGEAPNFESLNLNMKNRAVERLLDLMGEGHEELQLTPEELKRWRSEASAAGGKDSAAYRTAAARFWTSILQQRFNAFTQGGLGALPSYTYQGEKLSVKEEIQALLRADPGVASHFRETIQDVVTSSGAPAAYYWQLFKADEDAALCLGAMYVRKSAERTQIVDCQFYVSNAYFVSLTVYELLPVTVKGKPQTLLWRGDYVSAPSFPWLRGVEQMAATMLMSQGVRQSARLFQGDAAK